MLSLSDIKINAYLAMNNEPYVVISAIHNKQARGGAILKTKLKNLVTGNVIQHTFQGKDSVEEADLDKTKAQYLYKDNDLFNFMDNETYEQFTLSSDQLGEKANFLLENTNLDILRFEGEPINVELPIKMDLKIIEAPPGIRGNTAQGNSKQATIETGLKVNVPLFIKEGDVIKIDTRNGNYVERA
ncbi:MAG: hypothetical protein ACD_63C00091G0009 [uncultured bacterium]|nr:MAG: hypothetical protein ACD_63C00091G0009 [uncultured bacterium]